jgi:multiple sugar transport system substrate-binding protein
MNGPEVAVRFRIFLFVAALLLGASRDAQPSGGRPQEKTLTFAVGGAPSEVDYWEELLREFTARTGIRVELLRQPTDTSLRRQALSVALLARERNPDVFLMDVAWLAQFAASGWLAPLDPYFGRAGFSVREDFFPRIIELADTWKGSTVALPLYVDGGILYYRTDLLQKYGIPRPPATWEQLLEDARKVQRGERRDHPGFYGFVWQGAQYEGLVCGFLEFAGADGGVTADGGTVIVDTPRNREALRFMRDLIHEYGISPPNTYTDMKEEEARSFFQEGNALFERNWPYAWALHQAPGSRVKGVTGAARLPAFEPGRGTSCLGGWHVGLSRYADAAGEGANLIGFLTSYETQKKLALRLGWNSGRKDVYDDPEVAARLPYYKDLREVIERARLRPAVPYYNQVSEILQRRLNAALAGRISPGEALSAAQREIRGVLSRYD